MNGASWTFVRRWSRTLHRDIGYFLTAFVVAYCLSGLALNHADAWNPDFRIEKRAITLDRVYQESEIDEVMAHALSAQVGEAEHRVIDVPAEGQVKIYYDKASLLLDLHERRGVYERLVRRPLFYEVNVLHRNSLKPWRWAADVFSILLILVNLTGLLILKGKYGLTPRGLWFIAAGAVPPIVALVVFGTA
jgi:hypothetical protein